jgi:hypothetical protein
MRKLLLTGIATLFLATGTANADPLPNIFLGRWCHSDGGALEGSTNLYLKIEAEREWEVCRDGDKYMEITRHGWKRIEEDCKFISVKHTGEKTPVSTKPKKEDWVPVVRITARCHFEDGTAKVRVTFRYVKVGVLLLDEILPQQ